MAAFLTPFPKPTFNHPLYSTQTPKLFSRIMGSYEVDPKQCQNVVVMRHGDRMDNFNPLWTATAERPWDPPLANAGLIRAYQTGLKLQNELRFPIHRVVVSPFLRCLQTATNVVSGLFSIFDTEDLKNNGIVTIDPSKIKVSIEYGLCEMLNSTAIRPAVAPKDGVFTFDISKCESILPYGTIDKTAEPVYKELPKWQETIEAARSRYCNIIKALADKYPSENLLLVSHGEGVASAVCGFVPDVDTVYEVNYCAYSLLHRPIVSDGDQSPGELIGSPEEQVGVKILQ